MAVPRQSAYIWATWLPRLLTGENSCEWAVWFKAHYQDWTKVPSDFNQAQWMLNHTTLLTCEPLAGWRHVAITERRTMEDFAHQMRWLVDETYPDAPVVRVVLDNLNTHRTASLYETFPAAEARRIVRRLEFHHTPKHASWLNMAEIEFSVLTRACLQGRNPDAAALQRAVNAYEAERNAARATINWRFTTQDA